jgi:phage tail-like protein
MSTGQRADPYSSFRFAVQIDGIDEAVFSECTLPALEIDVHEQKEGGYNTGTHQLPGPVKGGRIILKRGITESSELLAMYMNVAAGNLVGVERQISVVMYDSKLTEVMRWNFLRAYPVKWSGPSFRTADNNIAIETLELVFSEVLPG